MTKGECVKEVLRLGEVMNKKPGPGQVEAYFEKFGQESLTVFHDAISHVLCLGRPPRSFEELQTIVAACREYHHDQAKRREKQQVNALGQAPKTPRIGRTDRQQAYGIFRSQLLLSTLRENKSFPQVMVEGLEEWLSHADNLAWAKSVTHSECTGHPHTLFECLRHEIARWKHEIERRGKMSA